MKKLKHIDQLLKKSTFYKLGSYNKLSATIYTYIILDVNF